MNIKGFFGEWGSNGVIVGIVKGIVWDELDKLDLVLKVCIYGVINILIIEVLKFFEYNLGKGLGF